MGMSRGHSQGNFRARTVNSRD